MSRTKKTIGYDAEFPKRLRKLLDDPEESGKRGSAAALAKAIGLQPQSISGWRRGESAPDFDNLIKIAAYFDVSVDWLLGRVPEGNRTTDLNVKEISSYTGLSSAAIEKLHKWNSTEAFVHAKDWLEMLSEMIVDDYPTWDPKHPFEEKDHAAVISSMYEFVSRNETEIDVWHLVPMPQTEMKNMEHAGTYKPGELYLGDNVGWIKIDNKFFDDVWIKALREGLELFRTKWAANHE